MWFLKKLVAFFTVKQTDYREEIKAYGCYLQSIIYACVLHAGYVIDIGHINKLYDSFQNVGWLGENCYVRDPSMLFQWFGLRVIYTGRHEDFDYKCKQNQIEILCFRFGKWDHFVLGDGKGRVIYDPLGESKAVAMGKLISKRIFEIDNKA